MCVRPTRLTRRPGAASLIVVESVVISARILREGMAAGWFTGKSLSTYLPAVPPLK